MRALKNALVEVHDDLSLLARTTFDAPDTWIICTREKQLLRHDRSTRTSAVRLPAVSLLQPGCFFFDVQLEGFLALLVEFSVLAIISICPWRQLLQIVRVHFFAGQVIVLLWLLFIFLVDLRLDINELVAAHLPSPLS